MSTDNNPFQSPALEGIRGSCTSDVEVEFDYELNDAVWFSLRESLQQHKGIILRGKVIFGCAAIVMGLASISCLFLPGISSVLLGAFVFPMAFFFARRAVWTKAMYKKNWRKQLERVLASRKNTGELGRCRTRLEEEGLTIERPGGQVYWRWWAVPAIETDDEGYLLIYVGSVDAYTIPARAFETDEHFEAFVANAMRLWNAKKLSE